MASRYVSDMRDAIKAYQGKVTKARGMVDEVREAYGDEAAQREENRQAKNLEAARATAEAAIRDAYSNGVYFARQWGQLNGRDLTDDAKLLDADLVDSQRFDELKAKYSGNYTMLTALKKYGDRKNQEAQQAAFDKGDRAGSWGREPFNVRDIPTLEGRLETWTQLKNGAVGLLDMLDGAKQYADPYMRGFRLHMGGKAVDSFGQGADV